MVTLFLIIFILAAILARILVLILPRPFTMTGFIRKKTSLYVHHIYIGLIIVVIVLPIAIVRGFSTAILVLLAIGLSLSLDELSAWITKSKYPERKEFIATVILYAIFILYMLALKI